MRFPWNPAKDDRTGILVLSRIGVMYSTRVNSVPYILLTFTQAPLPLLSENPEQVTFPSTSSFHWASLSRRPHFRNTIHWSTSIAVYSVGILLPVKLSFLKRNFCCYSHLHQLLLLLILCQPNLDLLQTLLATRNGIVHLLFIHLWLQLIAFLVTLSAKDCLLLQQTPGSEVVKIMKC